MTCILMFFNFVFLIVVNVKQCMTIISGNEVPRLEPGWELGQSLVPGRQHLYYVISHPVLECISELMLSWKRSKATFLLDESMSGRTERLLRDIARSRYNDIGILVDFVKVSRSSTTAVITDISRSSLSSLNVVVLCKDNLTTEIVNQADNLNLFGRNSLTWIILSTEWQKMFVSVEVKPQSQVTVVAPFEDGTLVLFDVFYSPLVNCTKAVKIARWSPNERLQMNEVFEPADREHKLWGRNILSAFFQEIPFAMSTGLSKNNETMAYGYMVELVEILLSTLNLREIRSFTFENFGIGIGRNYTGIIGVLFRREADISLNVLAMTLSRVGGCLFVGCVAKGYLGVIYQKPKAYVPPSIYLLPFSVGVWATTVGATVVFLATLALTWKSPWKSPQIYSRVIFSGDFFIDVFANPRGLIVRIIFGTFIVTIYLLTAFYDSYLTSCLTYQTVTLPFDSLEELSARADYTILLTKNSRHVEILQNASEGIYTKIWEKARKQHDKETFVQNLPEGISKIYTGKYAFIGEAKSLIAAASYDCNFAKISRQYSKEFFYMTVRHDFPYSPLIKPWMARAWESGVLHKLWKKYNLVEEQHCRDESAISLTLTLMQVMFVFALWGFGISLSLCCMLVETTIYARSKAN